MKKRKRILSAVLALLLLAAVPGFTGALAQGNDTAAAGITNDTDGDGIPDAAEKILGTNPYTADTDGDGVGDLEDTQPAMLEIPFSESSTAALPVIITDARVEDNQTADHLEISIKNTGADTLTGLEIYYTITDNKTGAQEAYYVNLDTLSIASGNTETIHFDNQVDTPNHFYGNMNGLYGTSANGLLFTVTLHAAGYAAVQFSIQKDAGTAEVAD